MLSHALHLLVVYICEGLQHCGDLVALACILFKPVWAQLTNMCSSHTVHINLLALPASCLAATK